MQAQATLPNRQTGGPPDWDFYKDIISQLYANNTLKDVMSILKTEYGFTPTIKQYKSQLAKWGFDRKRIKGREYLSILKHKRRRQREQRDRGTKFFMHGKLVLDTDITRFEKRMINQEKITSDETLSSVDTPKSLLCRTPTPSGAGDSSCFIERGPRNPASFYQLVAAANSSPYLDVCCPTQSMVGSSQLAQNRSLEVLESPHKSQEKDVVGFYGVTSPMSIDHLAQNTSSKENLDPQTVSTIPQALITNNEDFERLRFPSEFSVRTLKSPSVSSFDWWSAYVHSTPSPEKGGIHSSEPTNGIEGILRKIKRRVQSYEDEQLYGQLLKTCGNCPKSCYQCSSSVDQTSLNQSCRLNRFLGKLDYEHKYNALSERALYSLASHALHDSLPTMGSSPWSLFTTCSFWTYMGALDSDQVRNLHEYYQKNLESRPHAKQFATATLINAFISVERWSEALGLIKGLLGEQYTAMVNFCRQSESSECSLAQATMAVTAGRLTVYREQDGSMRYYPVGGPMSCLGPLPLEQFSSRSSAVRGLFKIRNQRQKEAPLQFWWIA